MKEVFRNAYFVVSLEPDAPIVRVSRTSTPFETLEDVTHRFLELGGVLDRLGRAGKNLLFDMREAPARNDPAFEQAMAQVHARVYWGFGKLGVLVRTAAGMLQVKRAAREQGVVWVVDTVEAVVLAALREPPARQGLR